MKKKLSRNKATGVITGVLSGLSEYFDVNVNIVRIIYVALSVFSSFFPGIIIYIILSFIMPEKNEIGHTNYKVD